MSDDLELTTLLEATLFGAGRSIPQAELAEQFKITESTIRMALLDLQQLISNREQSAIQLTEINRFWVLEVKPQLANHIPQIARTEIPKRLLKTAALIAYHQPMAQNKLVEMVGQVTYEHVSDLRELGLIDKRRDGNTRRLSNFLLWQIAYSEIFFEKKLWPDFTEIDYTRILHKFKKIKRNFGNI